MAVASSGSAWSMPSRWRIPCTTRSAISSSKLRDALSALRWATVGQRTTSPSIVGMSGGSVVTPGPVPPESGERPASMRCSSIGKASTSVGPSSPRKRSFRSAMACSSTNSMESSTSPFMPSASRTALAKRTQRMVSTSTAVCSSAAKTSTGTSKPLALGLLGRRPLVRTDDVLHDAVAHDVLGREVHEGQTLDPIEDLLEGDEPTAPTGDVDLGDVTRDDHLGAEADSRQEHLHLLGGGVLGLVEDDEAVVERAPAHESERRHLDGAALEEAVGTF